MSRGICLSIALSSDDSYFGPRPAAGLSAIRATLEDTPGCGASGTAQGSVGMLVWSFYRSALPASLTASITRDEPAGLNFRRLCAFQLGLPRWDRLMSLNLSLSGRRGPTL